MTRILVTGATGFIGRATLAPLLQSGGEVHAVSSRALGERDLRGVRWHRADLLNPTAIGDLLDRVGPTHLLHLAWYAQPGAFWSSPENCCWLEASLRLLRSFAARGGQRAVIAGTCAEYLWDDRTYCVEGRTPCRPSTLYGASKHALHLVAERLAEQADMTLAWGRVFFVYGPGEHPARLAASVSRSLVLGREAPCSHGEQVRDFIYSEDLAEAFVSLLRSQVEGPVNLASGAPVRVRDLVEALAAAAGRSDLVRLGVRPATPGEPTELSADVTRLRDEVGWRPAAGLQEHAADTIAWWRAKLRVQA